MLGMGTLFETHELLRRGEIWVMRDLLGACFRSALDGFGGSEMCWGSDQYSDHRNYKCFETLKVFETCRLLWRDLGDAGGVLLGCFT